MRGTRPLYYVFPDRTEGEKVKRWAKEGVGKGKKRTFCSATFRLSVHDRDIAHKSFRAMHTNARLAFYRMVHESLETSSAAWRNRIARTPWIERRDLSFSVFLSAIFPPFVCSLDFLPLLHPPFPLPSTSSSFPLLRACISVSAARSTQPTELEDNITRKILAWLVTYASSSSRTSSRETRHPFSLLSATPATTTRSSVLLRHGSWLAHPAPRYYAHPVRDERLSVSSIFLPPVLLLSPSSFPPFVLFIAINGHFSVRSTRVYGFSILLAREDIQLVH